MIASLENQLRSLRALEAAGGGETTVFLQVNLGSISLDETIHWRWIDWREKGFDQ